FIRSLPPQHLLFRAKLFRGTFSANLQLSQGTFSPKPQLFQATFCVNPQLFLFLSGKTDRRFSGSLSVVVQGCILEWE
ncbi:MAG: hypothetical protein MR914_01055, partial [Clostridiales bacterium]|nr:hypothetical protein [Clostridiales bacterium]